jgi:predicted RNA-binding protein YlqC (UPF0109 family)
MRETILGLVQPLVGDPGAVQLREDDSSGQAKFVLSLGREDMGRVIGREGRVIKAIRLLLEMAASARRVPEVRLEVEERPS